MKKKLLVILIFISLIFLLAFLFQEQLTSYLISPSILKPKGNGYSNIQNISNNNINNTQKEVIEVTKENKNLNYDYKNVEALSAEDLFKNKSELENVNSKGRIIIPTVNIDLGVFEGMSWSHLASGAVEQLPRSIIKAGGKGNYILTGHNTNLIESNLFQRLLNVKNGDYIYVTDENNLYKYVVNYSRKYHYTQTTPLTETFSDSKITLYTCYTPNSNNEYRWVVRGTLIEVLNLSYLDVLLK